MCDCDKQEDALYSRLGELRILGSYGAYNTTGGRSEFNTTTPVLYGPDGKVIVKDKPVFGFGS